MKKQVQIRRVYDDPAERDGTRGLVDRIWPRLTNQRASVDVWLNEAHNDAVVLLGYLDARQER